MYIFLIHDLIPMSHILFEYDIDSIHGHVLNCWGHFCAAEGWLSRRRTPLKQTTAAFNEKTKEEEELKLGKKAKSDQKKQQQQQQVSGYQSQCSCLTSPPPCLLLPHRYIIARFISFI